MTQQDAISISSQVLKNYMQAWNSRDAVAFSSCLHLPSLRINGKNQIQIFSSTSDISHLFEKLSAQDDFIQSHWVQASVIHASAEKIHIACSFNREFKEGKMAGPFHSLYILTFEQGRWGVRLRSSFHV
jgi:hypothetical protein